MVPTLAMVSLFEGQYSNLSEIGKGRLTVGKIYGGLLILENWKATKFGKTPMSDVVVSSTSFYSHYYSHFIHCPFQYWSNENLTNCASYYMTRRWSR